MHLTAHRLRHSFANDLLSADVPVTTIQKLLGPPLAGDHPDLRRRQRPPGAGRLSTPPAGNWRAGDERDTPLPPPPNATTRPCSMPATTACPPVTPRPSRPPLAGRERRPPGALPRLAARRRRQPVRGQAPLHPHGRPRPGAEPEPPPAARPRRRPGPGAGLRQSQGPERRVDRHVPRGPGQVPPLPAPGARPRPRFACLSPMRLLPGRPARLAGGAAGALPAAACSATGARRASTSRSCASGAATPACGAGSSSTIPSRLWPTSSASTSWTTWTTAWPPGYAARRSTRTCAAFTPSCSSCRTRTLPCPRPCCACPVLKQPDRLPRFLTDEQVRRLRDDFEERVAQAPLRRPAAGRPARPGRLLPAVAGRPAPGRGRGAAPGRPGPGRTQADGAPGQGPEGSSRLPDRRHVRALRDYLAWRGHGSDQPRLPLPQPAGAQGPDPQPHQAAAGKRVGVKVTAHRLRHTCATQLLNAGCRVTSIQRLLGHRAPELDHDLRPRPRPDGGRRLLRGHGQIEGRLDLAAGVQSQEGLRRGDAHPQLLCLLERLGEPDLTNEARRELLAQVRRVLDTAFPVPAPCAVSEPGGVGRPSAERSIGTGAYLANH